MVRSLLSYNQLFLNMQNGDPGAWKEVPSGHGVGYTRYLHVMPGQGEKATEVSAGDFVVPGPPAGGW